MAYEYLCHLRRLHSAPSKGKRFVEALGFAKGLVGADVSDALSSARVKGVAYGTETAPTRKSPFTDQQLCNWREWPFMEKVKKQFSAVIFAFWFMLDFAGQTGSIVSKEHLLLFCRGPR